ncbi:hypothetical protein KR222_007322, partial [Zaprionus bogoriensis]
QIVMDVGCRSGLLSYLAVEAGAIKVFAVGNMQSAGNVAKTLADGERAEVFEPLAGCLSQVKLPCGLKKVDIIVSEWMGHAIYADSLFCQVMFARDKWLAKGGYIIPNVANLYIHGISDHPRQIVKAGMPPVQLMDDYVNLQTVMTDKVLLKTVNLSTAKEDDEFFRCDFKLKAQCTGKISGCLLHFEMSCTNATGRLQYLFSIGPETPKTYMKQTLLFLEENSLKVVDQELLVGRFSMALSNFAPRGVEFSLALWRANQVARC